MCLPELGSVAEYRRRGCRLSSSRASSQPCCNNDSNRYLTPPATPPSPQVYADPEESLSLLIGWDSPIGSNGADVVSYVLELAPSVLGGSWTEPYFNVTVMVEDAAEMATTSAVGGNGLEISLAV